MFKNEGYICLLVHVHIQSTHCGIADLVNIVSAVNAWFAQFLFAAFLMNGDLAGLAYQCIVPDDLTTTITGLGATLTDHFELMTKNVTFR